MAFRQPTPLAQQLAWWRNAVDTGDGSISGDEPRCGWFKVRERAWSKNFLPARIWLHQPIDWQTGELLGPERHVLQIAERVWTDEMMVAEKWLYLRPVAMRDWKWLTARRALHQHLDGMRRLH